MLESLTTSLLEYFPLEIQSVGTIGLGLFSYLWFRVRIFHGLREACPKGCKGISHVDN